jgi:hypothetical protein
MIELFEVAAKVQALCEREGFAFCFIGGLALQRYGEPRVTRDVDLAVLAGFGGERPIAEAFLRAFAPRIPDALAFALTHRVLLLELGGVGIDLSLAALPYEEEMISRATAFEFVPGQPLRTCAAEDLIVLKAFASRAQDWIDVENVIVRQSTLDWDYILPRITELADLKEEPEILAKLSALRELHAIRS